MLYPASVKACLFENVFCIRCFMSMCSSMYFAQADGPDDKDNAVQFSEMTTSEDITSDRKTGSPEA